jgi:hypothetical protein
MQSARSSSSTAVHHLPENGRTPVLHRLGLRILLRSIRLLVYALSWRKCIAWPRNGSVFAHAWPQIDLEITMYSTEGRPLSYVLISLSRFFERWGKWRFYQRPDRWVLDVANRFELGRDPLLWKALIRKSRPVTPVEALVYWMRMREDDDRWLKSKSPALLELRRKKWEYHQRAVAHGLSEPLSFSFPELVDEVEKHLRRRAGVENLKDERYLQPHLWLKTAIQQGTPLKEALAKAPEPWRALVREQLRWEFWSLLGQVRLRRNFAQVLQYVAAMGKIFGESDPLRDEVIKWVGYLETIRG